jgi:hypothetical protein
MPADPPAGWWTPARATAVCASAVAYAIIDFYHRTGAAIHVPTVQVHAASTGDWLAFGIMGVILALSWGITLWGGAGCFHEKVEEKGLCAMTTVFAFGFSVFLTLVFAPNIVTVVVP